MAKGRDKWTVFMKTFVNIWFSETRLFSVLDKHRFSVGNVHWDLFSLAKVISAILRTHSITYHLGYVIFLIDGVFNRLKPTAYVMHHQFNIQQLYALPTLYLRVLYLSENKQRHVPLTA